MNLNVKEKKHNELGIGLIKHTQKMWLTTYFKGGTAPPTKINMFCALSQNNQQLFEKYLMHLIRTCSRNSKMALNFQ